MTTMSCNGIPAPKAVSIFSATLDGILAVITSLGNTAIIVVVYKDPLRKLKTPFMYFVVNLAISDLIVGLLYSPVGVYVHCAEAMGNLDETLAKLLHMSFFISITASILSLMALTVDRYIAITFPLKYRKYLTWKRCLSITCGIWFISLTIPFGYFKAGFIDYLVVDALASILLAFVIYIVVYVRIYRYLRKQTATLANHLKSSSSEAEQFQLTRLRQEKKTTRVFLIIILLFLVTYGPAAIMILILKFCPRCNCTLRHWLRDLVLVFIAINSSMNPFVYTTRMKTFRKSLNHLIKKFRKTRRDKARTITNESSSSNTQVTIIPNVGELQE